VVSTPIARALADWTASLDAQAVPDAVRALVPLRVLDHAGLVIAGTATEAGRAITAMVRAQAGTPACVLAGTAERVPAAAAALAHGTMAHCRDFDDTFMDSVVHPGSAVLPAALAIGEARNADDADFTAAVTAGYEVAARLGAVAGRRFHARAFHATGLIGPIAAAATAARCLRLDGERTAWAMGLAASMSGGLMAFMVDGGWSKWLHAGWAAHGGVTAAELAAQGFRGPEHVLDGGHDLYRAFLAGESVERAGILAGLGERWDGMGAEFKYYPCAHVIQPYIDAVLAIMHDHRLGAGDIAAVECAIAPWAAAIVCEPRDAKLRFETELDAIASLPFQLAHAIAEGEVGLDALSESSRRRADLATLAQRIEHVPDATLGRGFDGRLALRTTDGRTFERHATASGVDVAKLRTKFVRCAGAASRVQAGQAADRILAHAGWRAAVEVLAGR